MKNTIRANGECRHIAYNTVTGEVMLSFTGNNLKKMVKNTRYSGWIFGHNGYESIKKRVKYC